ncbi:MAG: ABC transporter, partial [Mycobacteriaceae bacterium]
MGLLDIITLPIRVTVATTEAALGMGRLAAPDGPLRRKGGYADQFTALIELASRLNALLADPHGPLALVNNLAALTSEDRPLGKAIAPGGALDHILAEDGVVNRFTSEGGPVDRLLSADGALERLLSAQGPLDRVLSEGGALDRITQEDGVLEQLFSAGGPLDRLLVAGGALDRITEEGGVLELLLRKQGLADRL